MSLAEHPLEHYKDVVLPFIISKKEEFALLGYEKVDINQIWDLLKVKKWKKNNEEKMLYQIVNDILHISISDYMNYIQVEAFKAPSLFDGDKKDALKGLI